MYQNRIVIYFLTDFTTSGWDSIVSVLSV